MKTIGILGGMGPAATVDLFDRIVKATPARRDQDHIPVVIVNNPAVPDRSEAILHGGDDPRPIMLDGLHRLAGMGADFAVIACNTAHYFLNDLRAASRIPILDMIGETAQVIRREHPAVERVGILATSGTLAVKLYQRALLGEGLSPVEPTEDEIAQMMDAIYGEAGIKRAGVTESARRQLCEAGKKLIERGAQALILGCTEIPLALKDGDLPAPLIASNQVLAQAAVRTALR
ncbi:MAG: amino acid racemase [Caldilineaceae bacterium]|nr:amino acid racemase [Caldilineaceae bacterium]